MAPIVWHWAHLAAAGGDDLAIFGDLAPGVVVETAILAGQIVARKLVIGVLLEDRLILAHDRRAIAAHFIPRIGEGEGGIGVIG